MLRKATILLTLTLFAAFGCGKQNESTPELDLHTAAHEGNVQAVRQHIASGIDLNQKDQYGATPLIVATTFGRTEVARALIEAGADVEAPSSDGSTPLHIAAFFCHEEIVASLLEHGADRTVRNGYGSTPLESVQSDFETVKPFYDAIGQGLAPFGLELDYERIAATRPKIASMLQE